jgi:anti-sigma factor RsiW
MASPTDMTCQELVELVTDYVENTLPPADRERFDAHISVCGPCRTYLAQMEQTIRLTGQLTEEAIAPDVQQELLNTFRNWKPSR